MKSASHENRRAASATEDPAPAVDATTATAAPEGNGEPPRGEERAADPHEHGDRPRHRGKRMPLWLDTLVTMVVALVIAVLVKTFLIQPFYIPSASMNPTLLEDDKIIVSKLSPGVFDLERGDVIVF